MIWLIGRLISTLDRIHPKAPDVFVLLLWVGAVILAGLYTYGLIELCIRFPIFVIR